MYFKETRNIYQHRRQIAIKNSRIEYNYLRQFDMLFVELIAMIRIISGIILHAQFYLNFSFYVK